MAALAATTSNAQPITAGEHTRVNTVYGPIEGYKDGSIFYISRLSGRLTPMPNLKR